LAELLGSCLGYARLFYFHLQKEEKNLENRKLVFRTRSTQVCREYTKEAEDFFQKPPMSANDEGASTSDIDDDIEENEAESSTDEKPVLSLGRGRSRLRSRYFRLHCVKYV
jgi:hypothetical protein